MRCIVLLEVLPQKSTNKLQINHRKSNIHLLKYFFKEQIKFS